MCCVSLACNLHQNTTRIVDHCSNKIQRGTCAKNTIRFLKNDPNLTCPHCTVRCVQNTAYVPSGHIKYDIEQNLVVAAHDYSHIERMYTHIDSIRSSSNTQVANSSPLQSSSLLVSTESDFQLGSHLELDDYDLAELSHEDGLQLIDEMYDAEHMDTNDDEIYYVPAETNHSLEEIYNRINDTAQSNQEDAMNGDSFYSLRKYGSTAAGFDNAKEIYIEANVIQTKGLLRRARQDVEKL